MKGLDKRTYPAIIVRNPSEEYQYSVMFPDLPGCITEGRTQNEALEMAQEALGLHLYGLEEDGDDIPAPSESLTTGEGEAVALITVNFDSFREIMENKYVKKTLTIPAKLNITAENAGVNFSQLLQQALKEYLGR